MYVKVICFVVLNLLRANENKYLIKRVHIHILKLII